METKQEEVKINNIVLNVGKKEIVLTVEQAKKLKSLLEDLFGKEIIKEVKHEHHYDWWYRPYYVEKKWPSFNDNIFYCDAKLSDSTAKKNVGLKADYTANSLMLKVD